MNIEIEQRAGFTASLVDNKVVECVVLAVRGVSQNTNSHEGLSDPPEHRFQFKYLERAHGTYFDIHEILHTDPSQFWELRPAFAQKCRNVVTLLTLSKQLPQNSTTVVSNRYAYAPRLIFCDHCRPNTSK